MSYNSYITMRYNTHHHFFPDDAGMLRCCNICCNNSLCMTGTACYYISSLVYQRRKKRLFFFFCFCSTSCICDTYPFSCHLAPFSQRLPLVLIPSLHFHDSNMPRTSRHLRSMACENQQQSKHVAGFVHVSKMRDIPPT